MSDTSLYSSLYEQIREYAELVDDVLIKVKEGNSSPGDASRQKLGRLLMNFAEDRWDDLPTRLIGLMLHDKSDFDQSNWARVGKALTSSELNESVVESLESLARSLQEEHAEAVSRIQGWAR